MACEANANENSYISYYIFSFQGKKKGKKTPNRHIFSMLRSGSFTSVIFFFFTIFFLINWVQMFCGMMSPKSFACFTGSLLKCILHAWILKSVYIFIYLAITSQMYCMTCLVFPLTFHCGKMLFGSWRFTSPDDHCRTHEKQSHSLIQVVQKLILCNKTCCLGSFYSPWRDTSPKAGCLE